MKSSRERFSHIRSKFQKKKRIAAEKKLTMQTFFLISKCFFFWRSNIFLINFFLN